MNSFAETANRISVPPDSYANVSLLPEDAPPPTPDNPPWGAGTALGVWLVSVLFLMFVPMLLVVPYLIAKDAPFNVETLGSNPTVLALSLLGTLPAHLLTLLLVWAVVTAWRKRDFAATIGWKMAGASEIVWCVLLGVGLYFLASLTVYFLGSGKETSLEAILRSSPLARYTGAFLAAVTAPVVEELVYRGVLYSGLRKAANAPMAVILVTFLFTLVHVEQYKTNPAVILVILLLSLALTMTRVHTGRVLPCVLIHLVFNGIQSVLLAFGLEAEKAPEAAPQPAAWLGALAQFLG